MNIVERNFQLDARTRQAVMDLFRSGELKLEIRDITNTEEYRGNYIAIRLKAGDEVLSESVTRFMAVFN